MRTLLCLALLVVMCVLTEATENHKGNLRALHRLMKRQATAKVRILNRNDQHIPDISSPPSSGQSAYVYSQSAASRHQGMTSDGSTSLRASGDRTSSRGRSPSSSSSATSGAVRPSQTYSYPFGRERTQYVYERPPARNRTQASDVSTGGGERDDRRVGDGRDDQSRERSRPERTRSSGYSGGSQRGSTVETRDSARQGPPSALTRREDVVSDEQALSREEEMKRRLEERAVRLRQREEALRRRQELEDQRRRQIEADEVKRKEEDEQRRQQREEELRRRQVAEEERRRRIEEIEQQRRRRQEEESEGGAGQASEEERRRQEEERRRRYYEQQRARQYSTPAPGGLGSRSQPTTDQRSPQRTEARSGSNQPSLTGAPPIAQGRYSGQNGGTRSTSQQGGSAGYTQQSSPGLTRYSVNYPGSRGQGVYIPTNPSQSQYGGSQTNQQGSQVYPNQRLGSGQYYQPQGNPRIASPGRGSYSGFRTRYETNGQVLGEYGAGNEWNLYPAVDQSGSSECPETGLDIRINGLDCPSAVRSYGTYLCYTHEYTSRQCCEVCLPRKQPSRVGCEYGDHTELCSTITPADCYDLRNKHSCCDTCEKYRRANAPTGCEYGDMTPRCENVRQNPGLCYIPDNQRLCCDTCNQIKNISNLSCAWGDYNPSLCQIYDESSSSIRLNCYAPQRRRLCCESCDRLREWMPKDMPADCQYGDRPVFFNTGQYGRLNCTSLFTIFSIDECRTNSAVAINCCYTCARLLGGRG